MKFSCNEFETIIRKAAVAMCYPVGLAEDIAAAALLLSGGGYNGAGAALRSLSGGYSAPAVSARRGALAHFNCTNAAAVGMGAAELLVAEGRAGARVTFNAIDSPLLLGGMACWAARCYGASYLLTLQSKRYAISPQGALGLDGISDVSDNRRRGARDECSGALSLQRLQRRARLRGEVKVAANAAAEAPLFILPQDNRINLSPDNWRALSRLAAQTYVAVSTASRAQGAGAGEIDND